MQGQHNSQSPGKPVTILESASVSSGAYTSLLTLPFSSICTSDLVPCSTIEALSFFPRVQTRKIFSYEFLKVNQDIYLVKILSALP